MSSLAQPLQSMSPHPPPLSSSHVLLPSVEGLMPSSVQVNGQCRTVQGGCWKNKAEQGWNMNLWLCRGQKRSKGTKIRGHVSTKINWTKVVEVQMEAVSGKEVQNNSVQQKSQPRKDRAE